MKRSKNHPDCYRDKFQIIFKSEIEKSKAPVGVLLFYFDFMNSNLFGSCFLELS